MSNPANPQCQSYKRACETPPEIREAMRRDKDRAVWGTIISKSDEAPIIRAAERAWRVLRGMYPARWG